MAADEGMLPGLEGMLPGWHCDTWVAPWHQEGYVVILFLLSFMAGQPGPSPRSRTPPPEIAGL